MVGYQTRFIPQGDATALINLWHLAKVPCGLSSYKRMLKAAKWYHEEHPEVSATGAYKDLDGLLAQ